MVKTYGIVIGELVELQSLASYETNEEDFQFSAFFKPTLLLLLTEFVFFRIARQTSDSRQLTIANQ